RWDELQAYARKLAEEAKAAGKRFLGLTVRGANAYFAAQNPRLTPEKKRQREEDRLMRFRARIKELLESHLKDHEIEIRLQDEFKRWDVAYYRILHEEKEARNRTAHEAAASDVRQDVIPIAQGRVAALPPPVATATETPGDGSPVAQQQVTEQR